MKASTSRVAPQSPVMRAAFRSPAGERVNRPAKSGLGLFNGSDAVGKTTLQRNHIAPEVLDASSNCFVRDGDLNRVYVAARALQLLVDENGLVAPSRGATPMTRYTRGVLIRHLRNPRNGADPRRMSC